MFGVSTSGSFSKLESFLQAKSRNEAILRVLEKGGLQGVMALRLATPSHSGRTAAAWDFIIEHKKGVYILTFTNNDIEDGFPVAVMIQYGHGTANGGYVEGIDYINPALAPLFKEISDEIWKVVTSS